MRMVDVGVVGRGDHDGWGCSGSVRMVDGVMVVVW